MINFLVNKIAGIKFVEASDENTAKEKQTTPKAGQENIYT